MSSKAEGSIFCGGDGVMFKLFQIECADAVARMNE